MAYGDLRIAVVDDDDVLRDDVLVPRMRHYGFDLVPMRNAEQLQASLVDTPATDGGAATKRRRRKA